MITSIKALDIVPYGKNPRLNEKTIIALKTIIEEYGFLVPLTVTKDYTIITGHSRYEAGIGLGMTEFPCTVLDIPEAESREYRLVDNKIQEYSITDYIKSEQELMSISGGDEFFKEMFNIGKLTKDDVILNKGIIESIVEDKEEDAKVELLCPYCYHQWTEIDT